MGAVEKAISDLRAMVDAWEHAPYSAMVFDAERDKRVIRECLNLVEMINRQKVILLDGIRRVVALDCHPTDSQTIRAYLHSECILEARQALKELEKSHERT